MCRANMNALSFTSPLTEDGSNETEHFMNMPKFPVSFIKTLTLSQWMNILAGLGSEKSYSFHTDPRCIHKTNTEYQGIHNTSTSSNCNYPTQTRTAVQSQIGQDNTSIKRFTSRNFSQSLHS